PEIRLSREHGRFCLFYGVRIAPEEADDARSPIRRRCLQDGNHFVWPLRGMTSQQLLEWKQRHADWHLDRMGVKVAMLSGLVSAQVTALGLLLGR
ncbi:MAG: hypothetical protein D6791_18230, partial [Chloroflexi bacterium]